MGRSKRMDGGPLLVAPRATTASSGVVRRLDIARAPAPSLPGLVALRLEDFDEEAGTASLRVGEGVVQAAVDPSVEPAVLRTARARRERVIAQQEGEGWVVLGTLRTQATPGVDEGDEFLIKARRVVVVAAHEIALVSGAASIVARAFGQVETLADQITSRAASVHKIVGRMIRLN